MNILKIYKKYNYFELHSYYSNKSQGNLQVSRIVDNNLEFMVFTLFWKYNFLNHFKYLKYKKMTNEKKLYYSQCLTEKIISLEVLKKLSEVYPEQLMKDLITENEGLTLSSLGFSCFSMCSIIDFYIENYYFLKKKDKTKYIKPHKKDKLLNIVDAIYKEKK